jgi:hypothetical protein
MVMFRRLMAALWLAGASASSISGAPSPACDVPASAPAHPLLGRQERLAQLEALPESCLKSMVVECSSVASTQMLDAASAAACSMSYEALLKRSFGGDFQEMLTWWRGRHGHAQSQ